QPVFDVQRSAGCKGRRRQPATHRRPCHREPAAREPALSGRRGDGARGRRRADHAGAGAQRDRRCAGAIPGGVGGTSNADRTLLMKKALIVFACVSLMATAACKKKSEGDAAPVVTVDVAPVLL